MVLLRTTLFASLLKLIAAVVLMLFVHLYVTNQRYIYFIMVPYSHITSTFS